VRLLRLRGKTLCTAPHPGAAQRGIFRSALCFFAIILIFASCATQKADSARIQAEQKFNKSQYLTAVGYGNSYQEAEQNALANLISIFEQSVKSNFVITEKYYEESAKNTSSSKSVNTNQSIESSSSINTLSGAEIGDTWFDNAGKIYCSVAVMDRAQCGAIYQGKLDDNLKLISGALKTLSGKNTIQDAGLYYYCAKLADDNSLYAGVLSVLTGRNPAVNSAGFYQQEAANIAKNITIGIEISVEGGGGPNGDYKKSITSAFSGVFNGLGFKTDSGGSSNYLLKASLSLQPLPATDQFNNKFVRYELNANLIDKTTNKVLFVFSRNGREGHLTTIQAEARAVGDVVDQIQTDFETALVSSLGGF